MPHFSVKKLYEKWTIVKLLNQWEKLGQYYRVLISWEIGEYKETNYGCIDTWTYTLKKFQIMNNFQPASL